MELVKAANMIGQRCEPKHIEEKSLARAHSRVLAKLESQQGGLDFVSLAVRALATSALQPRSVLCSRGALGRCRCYFGTLHRVETWSGCRRCCGARTTALLLMGSTGRAVRRPRRRIVELAVMSRTSKFPRALG